MSVNGDEIFSFNFNFPKTSKRIKKNRSNLIKKSKH